MNSIHSAVVSPQRTLRLPQRTTERLRSLSTQQCLPVLQRLIIAGAGMYNHIYSSKTCKLYLQVRRSVFYPHILSTSDSN